MSLSSLIPVGAWLWEKHGKTITDTAGEKLKERWQQFKWNEASAAYRYKVKKLYGTMQIMGMKSPVPLDDIFTDAYLLDRPTAFSRHDIQQLKSAPADPSGLPPGTERVDGVSLVKTKIRREITIWDAKPPKKMLVDEHRNLFILGKPGAGKTTFLKYIAVSADQHLDKVPIFVGLKQWADSGLNLMSYLGERFDVCNFPEAQPFIDELLKSGKAIVLFDGLDEVNLETGERDRQTRAMEAFFIKYDKTQFLVTCRIAASHYSFQNFTYVEIADFTDAQIRNFVGNWFRNKDGQKDDQTRNRFLTEFEKSENQGLRELARTPLLLTLLCIAFDETMTFPQRRVEIYEEALGALLKKWDSSRRIKRDEIYQNLSPGHKENMLARIAAETFEKNEYFIDQGELERLITNYINNVPPHETIDASDAEAILKAIEEQHGIFVERSHRVYSFSHLTFQEYFTARYCVANAGGGTLRNMVNHHCADSRWREVFLLTTSLLPDATHFMNIFRQTIDQLIADDAQLHALLSWATKKSSLTQNDSAITRLNYLHLAVHYYSDNYRLRQALDYGLNYVVNSIQDLDVALDRVLTDIHRNLSKVGALGDINTVIHRCRQLKLYDLADRLLELDTAFSRPYASRANLTDQLRTTMREHRDLGWDWGLDEVQEDLLAKYIRASCLLQDYSKLAFMNPVGKKELLESLFLPPEE
jgi:predicted NACHT family NTPase